MPYTFCSKIIDLFEEIFKMRKLTTNNNIQQNIDKSKSMLEERLNKYIFLKFLKAHSLLMKTEIKQ